MGWLKRFVFLIGFLWQSANAFAGDISLTVSVSSQDDLITVTVANAGRDTAGDLRVAIELDQYRSGEQILAPALGPGEQKAFQARATLPAQRGSYALITTVSYLNAGERLSVTDVGHFYSLERRELEISCRLPDITLRGSDTFTFTPYSTDFRLILPPEIPADVSRDGQKVVFRLEDVFPGMQMNYSIFGLYETRGADGVHGVKICPARLLTRGLKRSPLFGASALSFLLFALLYGGGALMAFAECRKRTDPGRFLVSLTRFLFSGAMVSALFFIFYGAWHIPENLLPHLEKIKSSSYPALSSVATSLEPLLRWFYFDGHNYNYFNRYIAPWLFAYMLTLNFFTIYFLVRPDPKTDKYWHLMLSCFSLLPFGRDFWRSERGGRVFYWNEQSRVALLAICVKSFYVPMFLSWTVNNLIHINNQFGALQWEFFWLNRFVIDLFIFIDVLVFCIAYFSELPGLKNQIRSVEPTFFGWFICLICYPPFNGLIFVFFDRPITSDWAAVGGYPLMAVQLAITALWFVYLGATIALGLKASNLTNRGIVWGWPYSLIRHPAYAAKVSVWLLSSFFLNTMNGALALSLVVIYTLRAITEERHLSRDPEYLRYKSKVKWAAIPGLF